MAAQGTGGYRMYTISGTTDAGACIPLALIIVTNKSGEITLKLVDGEQVHRNLVGSMEYWFINRNVEASIAAMQTIEITVHAMCSYGPSDLITIAYPAVAERSLQRPRWEQVEPRALGDEEHLFKGSGQDGAPDAVCISTGKGALHLQRVDWYQAGDSLVFSEAQEDSRSFFYSRSNGPTPRGYRAASQLTASTPITRYTRSFVAPGTPITGPVTAAVDTSAPA